MSFTAIVAAQNFKNRRLKLTWLFTCYFLMVMPFTVASQAVYFIKRTTSAESPFTGSEKNTIGLFSCDLEGKNVTQLGWRGLFAYHFAYTTNHVMFLAAGNGILVSRDRFETFKIATDWQVAEVLALQVVSADESVLVAGTAFGVWKSDDGGQTWHRSSRGLRLPGDKYVSAIISDFENRGIVYAASANGIKRSINQGRSWTNFGLYGKQVTAVRQSSSNPKSMLASTDRGIFASCDKGITWKQTYKSQQSILGVTYDPSNRNITYAYGIGTGLLFSSDSGITWSSTENVLSHKTVLSLAIDKTGSYLFAGTEDGLWYSSDRGINFKCVSTCDGRISFVSLME